MERQGQKLVSPDLNTRLFTVVGPSYVFDNTSEFSSSPEWAPPRPPLGRAQRWLLLGVLAALIVALFSISTISAGPRKTHALPFSQLAGGATSFSFAGGTEAARW